MPETRRSLMRRIGISLVGAVAFFSPQNVFGFFRRKRRWCDDGDYRQVSAPGEGKKGKSHVKLKNRGDRDGEFHLEIDAPASGGSIAASVLATTGATGKVTESATITATLFSSFPTGSKQGSVSGGLSWAAKFAGIAAGSYCLVIQATATSDGSVLGATVNFTVT